jgi:neutral ceramidase
VNDYFSCLLIAALSLLISAPLPAEENDWQVGLARVKITPSEPVRMAGYASRKEPSHGVASDLYAKALAIEDGRGHRAVLITTDVLGFAAAIAEPTCQKIIDQTGLSRNQILLNSSHTHTGPTLSLDESALDFPEDQARATVLYTRGLQQKLVELASSSLQQLEPAELSWGVGVATFPMNRREFTERGVILGVNPRGLCDRSVPVLRISKPDGSLRAVLFGAACHNTTLGGRDMNISGDFAGYAQTRIERSFKGAQAMFMQGCAGDANPFPRGTEQIARLHGAALGEEVIRVLKTDLQPVQGPLRSELQPVAMPLVSGLSRAEIEAFGKKPGGWRGFVTGKMTEVLDSGGQLPTDYTSLIAVWQFGQDLTLVALPGEVVVDYVALLEKALGPRKLWIAAYSNDVYGYLPSARVLDEGGYETRGLYAGSVGLFSPHAQDVVVQRVREIAEAAGRNGR